MKIICVTGAPGTDLNMVAEMFSAAGAAPAQSLRQDPSFTLNTWHEKVLASSGDRRTIPGPVQQPGRFWEQLAANLFLENMQHRLWTWADARSVWLLDFWQQFEPNLHFVLVYTSPQRALAEALANERDRDADTAALMASWEAHQKEILRFHHRNPQRTILVDAAECLADPAALLDACATRWHLELAPHGTGFPTPPAPAPLIGYLAEQLKLTHPELEVLQQELEASLLPLLPHQAGGMDMPDLFAAVDDYRQVRDAAARADTLALRIDTLSSQIASLETELDSARRVESGLHAKYDLAVVRVGQLENELSLALAAARDLRTENSSRDSTISTLKQTLAESQSQASKLKTMSDEANSKNGQLLLQMQQLQEDLERLYLENKQVANGKLESTRVIEQLRTKVSEYEASVKTLQRDLQAARTNQGAEKEKTEAQAALAAAKKELDRERQGLARLEEERRALSAKVTQQQTALEAATGKADDARQENELLLAQLHQIQGEMEHYFLEHKKAVAANNELSSRWQRMLERHPAYCDYRSLELLDLDQDGERTSWRFVELNAAGRAFPELRFDVEIVDGQAVFAFARDGMAPVAQSLDALSTSDWMLLPTLCRLLDEALLAGDRAVARIGGEQRAALRAALARLIQAISAMAPALRVDGVSLRREQINPDYEHLWLHLNNLSLGDKRWPEVEFRLSCANVRPGKFGAYPKLEFPSEIGAVMFDSWFVESYDDFGEKLELRFALPEAMDMSVWEQLSQNDRAMMAKLIAILPTLLSRLEHAGQALARPYADWQQLAAAVQRILAIRTQAAKPVAAPSAPPADTAATAGKAKPVDGLRKRNSK